MHDTDQYRNDRKVRQLLERQKRGEPIAFANARSRWNRAVLGALAEAGVTASAEPLAVPIC
jgi:hypothetical protein